jgi:predicted ATPase
MRTLERITVTGYKSIRELRDFELGDINVLIGANGAGKSNFLSVFKLLWHLANNDLQLFVGREGADYLLHFGAKTTEQIKINLRLKQQYIYEYEAILEFAKPNRLIFNQERYSFDNRDLGENLGIGHEETKLPDSVNFGQVRLILEEFRVYHFQDTTDKAKVKLTPDINDNYALKADAANLAAFFYRLKNTELFRSSYNRIVQTVRLAAPFFDDFVLRPLDGSGISLRWKHRNSTDDFDTRHLSDGTLRFICLTTLLLQPNPPKLIIIDEPELGLHPAAIGLLVEMLQSVATNLR